MFGLKTTICLHLEIVAISHCETCDKILYFYNAVIHQLASQKNISQLQDHECERGNKSSFQLLKHNLW